jgi:hypothetical protein
MTVSLIQNSIDLPPSYQAISKNDGMLTDIWNAWFNTFYQVLVSFYSQFGLILPNIDTTTRDNIINPVNGQMIFNTTTMNPEIWINGSWRTINHT